MINNIKWHEIYDFSKTVATAHSIGLLSSVKIIRNDK